MRTCEYCGASYTSKVNRPTKWCSPICGQRGRAAEAGRAARPPAVVAGQRKCTSCLVVKPVSEFHHRTRRGGAPIPRCKDCTAAYMRARTQTDAFREQRYQKKYGVTLAWYEETLAAQGGVCAICQRPETGAGRSERLNIDHCHTTGKARGLLCFHCNSAIGHLQDNTEWMARAITYVQ